MANLRYAVYRAALEATYVTGVHRVLRPLVGGVGAILTFHRVLPARSEAFQPNSMIEIETEFLDRLIGYLRARKLDLVSMDEVHRRLTERDFRRRFVALTFDDGYRDNLECAWPVLRRYEAPFMIYVATSFPDRLGELWWVALEQVIAKVDRLAIEMNGATHFIACGSVAEKRAAFDEVYWWLRSKNEEEELRRAIRDICARYGVDLAAPCRELCMDWAEIGRMAEDPLCSIGAHTINHVILRKVSAAAARTEMQRSAEILEAALGRKIDHLAYPYGEERSVGPRDFKIAGELGFKTAVTTLPDVLRPSDRDALMSLPRISVNGNFQATRIYDVLLSGLPFAVRGRKTLEAA